MFGNVWITQVKITKCHNKSLDKTRSKTFSITRKQTENRDMVIQQMTKITHAKITHYIDDTKKYAIEYSNACRTFTGFPRDFQLNTTDAPSTTIGGHPFHWKCLSNKFLFEIDKIFSLPFNATFHWIQIDIFIVVNKHLVR